MKSLVALSALFALTTTASVTIEDTDSENKSDYLTKSVSLVDKIQAEKAQTTSKTFNKLNVTVEHSLTIINGNAARLGDLPYQAGLIIDILYGIAVCGGSLLNSRRVLTAAHCWYDDEKQGVSVTVVLGSIKLYSGGTRIQTSQVVTHSQYQPQGLVNDIAMIYLPHDVEFSDTIQPIALPSTDEVLESFVGNEVIASGFGITKDGTYTDENTYLSYVSLRVITNAECAKVFGPSVRPSTICASGDNNKNTCNGDSGGPIALFKNNRRILLGVTSFGTEACETDDPSGYTRVTYYIDWITSQL